MNQKALIDDLVAIPGWEPAGYVRLVSIPHTLAFVFHYILGSFLISQGHHASAIELLMTPVRDRNARNSSPLYKTPRLIGWPEALSGNATDSWKFLLSVFDHNTWLSRVYPRKTAFEKYLRAYALTASLLELAEFIQRGNKAESLQQEMRFDVPPLFTACDDLEEVVRTAVPSARIVETIGAVFTVSPNQIRSVWPTWLKALIGWMFRGGYHRIGICYGDAEIRLP